jgi:hypothetical protein
MWMWFSRHFIDTSNGLDCIDECHNDFTLTMTEEDDDWLCISLNEVIR